MRSKEKNQFMTTTVDLSAYPPSIPDEHHKDSWSVRTVRIVIVDTLQRTTLVDGFGPNLTIAQFFHDLEELPLTGEQASEMARFRDDVIAYRPATINGIEMDDSVLEGFRRLLPA
jgi:hypothetical protein